MSKKDFKRVQSIKYVLGDDDDDGPELRFGSLERGTVDEDEYHQRDKRFNYNNEQGIYTVNSLDKSRLSEQNLDRLYSKVEEEDVLKENKDFNNSSQNEEEDAIGGNIIFANTMNIDSKEKKLKLLYIIMFSYLSFSLIEIYFGYYSNSITLMADAAHYFSESSCFAIYIISIYVSRKKATNIMSFGFHRGEIIGVLVRATFLLGFSFWLLYYTFLRFLTFEIVNGFVLIILGIISLFYHLILGLVLVSTGIGKGISFSEKDKNNKNDNSKRELNYGSLKQTFKDVVYKGIQTCIIILAGVLIYFLPNLKYVDPCCTLLLTAVLLFDAYEHMDGVITILMEASPLEFDAEKLERELLTVKGVIEVHDIHVWSLSIGKLSMSCHLTTSEPQNSLVLARDLIKNKYNITHTTIQVELYKENKKKCKGNLH